MELSLRVRALIVHQSYRLAFPRPVRGFFARNTRTVGRVGFTAPASFPPPIETQRGATEPRCAKTAWFPFCVGRRSGQGDEEEMDRLKKLFESEVDGIVFWPIIIVMLVVLIPIVMEIR